MKTTKDIMLSSSNIVPMTKEQVLEQFDKFLWKQARSYQRTLKLEVEDLYQMACMALVIAYDKYDISTGYKFLTFLAIVVSSKLNQCARRQRKYHGVTCTSLNEEVRLPKGGNSVEFVDILKDNSIHIEEDYLKKDCSASMYKYMSILTAREQAILHGLYWEGKNQKQLSKELRISQPQVSRLKLEALNRLSRLLRHYQG